MESKLHIILSYEIKKALCAVLLLFEMMDFKV